MINEESFKTSKKKNQRNSNKKCQARYPNNHLTRFIDPGKINKQICMRPVWDDDAGLCIFHCAEKSADEFRKSFVEELERTNNTNTIRTFDGDLFIFPQNISLENLEFKKPVSFAFAQFNDQTYFSETVFVERATFGGAQFGHRAYFRDVKFMNLATFRLANFGNSAFFGNTQFGNGAYFDFVQFGDRATFRETKFNDVATFTDAKFGDRVSFEGVKVGSRLVFKGARFAGELIFKDFEHKEINSQAIIEFTSVYFEKPNQIHFHNVSLCSCLLANTNVQEVNFLECVWPKVPNQDRCGVFDEILFRIASESDSRRKSLLSAASLGEIEQLYLRLQSNFENNKHHNVAGEFYIGAMEMRRKRIAENNSETWQLLRQNVFSIEAWYHHVSLYGERWARTLVWMLLVILSFPMFYLLAGFQYPEMNPTNGQINFVNYELGSPMRLSYKDYLKALDVSFHTFTFQRGAPFRLKAGGRILSAVESALSATLLALFLLAIRRRFKR